MPQCSSAKGKTNKHELNQETSLDEPIDSPIIYENINFLLIIIFSKIHFLNVDTVRLECTLCIHLSASFLHRVNLTAATRTSVAR